MTPKYIAWLILGMGGPEDLSRGLGAPRLALCEGCRIGSRAGESRCRIGHLGIGLPTLVWALPQWAWRWVRWGRNPQTCLASFRAFFSSPKWASVPALLFMLATLIFIVRLVGISAPAQQNNFLDKPANVETITSRTFTNERVTIDGREFYNCVC